MSGILAGLRLDLEDEDFAVYLGDVNLAQGWADTGFEWTVNIFLYGKPGAPICDAHLGPFPSRTEAITAAFDALLHRDGITYTRATLPTFAPEATESTLSPSSVESGPERLLALADANSTAQVSYTQEQMRVLAAKWQALEVGARDDIAPMVPERIVLLALTVCRLDERFLEPGVSVCVEAFADGLGMIHVLSGEVVSITEPRWTQKELDRAKIEGAKLAKAIQWD